MECALKNLTSLPPEVAEAAFHEARESGQRLFIVHAPAESRLDYHFMPVGEFNLLCAEAGPPTDPRSDDPPEHLATARPGGVVNSAW